jgi:hypothetical protein
MAEAIEAPEGSNRRLNRMVAITVVLLSVLMAVGKIKDDNIVQAMQAAQATKIDLWNEYQANRLKAHGRDIETRLLGQLDPKASEITAAAAESRRYQAQSDKLRAQAKAAERDYDVQGRRDDQFDLADGFLSIAIAVAAISALVESMTVLTVSWISAALGLLFLVAGFAELPIHPDFLVNFLT